MRQFYLDSAKHVAYNDNVILRKSCKMEVFHMLLEFRFQNYKSFREETSFSMMAAPKQKGLDYSLFNIKKQGKDIKGLCSSVIYGSNAAGKTTVVGAMDTFRSIVLRGNIRNSEDISSPNHAASNLSLVPNQMLTKPEPVEFFIDFVVDKFRIQYGVVMDLGLFLDDKYERKILSEVLTVNGNMIFERKHLGSKSVSLKVEPCKDVATLFSKTAKADNASAVMIAMEGLDCEELFLTGGFKLIFSQSLVKMITDWFTNQFIVVYRADAAHLERRFSNPKENSIYVSETLNNAINLFGVNANPVGYTMDKDSEAKLVSLIPTGDNQSVALPADIYESYGTIRFINLFPLVIRALRTGATLVVDEFDASIHPIALMNILNLFHNDEINIHHAQLIFNTHNPIFLNANLLRRDEIKFVERDSEDHTSTLFTLSDFGTAGENGVRKNDDYLKSYLANQYCGISEVDLYSVFEKLNYAVNGLFRTKCSV